MKKRCENGCYSSEKVTFMNKHLKWKCCQCGTIYDPKDTPRMNCSWKEDLQKGMDEAIQNIIKNHSKIIEDFCKSYLAQRFEEGKSIKPGSFVLNEQDQSKDGNFGKRYWFTEGLPDYSKEDEDYLFMKIYQVFEQWNLLVCHCEEDNQKIIKEIIKFFRIL